MTNENPKSEDTSYEEAPENGKKKGIDANRGTFPVTLLSFTFMFFLGFQTWNLVCDQKTLTDAYIQQGQTLEQVKKVKAQLGALAKGTVELAGQGNRSAQEVLDTLKKAGVNIQDRPTPEGAPAAPASDAPKLIP